MPPPPTHNVEEACDTFVVQAMESSSYLLFSKDMHPLLDALLQQAFVAGASWGIYRVESIVKGEEAGPCPPPS